MSAVPTEFDLLRTKLRTGASLIEASAGTGKTYSLAGIILRLILEQHIGIEQILAVTFTIAATAELKERVRRRLHEALVDLRRGATDDPVLQPFLSSDRKDTAIRDLDAALIRFDEAQVFTIHGFCQRVLRDHAFETGTGFDTTLVTDPTASFEQVALDFWRITMAGADEIVAAVTLAWGHGPSSWTELLSRLRNHPVRVLLPEHDKRHANEIAEQLTSTLVALRAEWKKSRDAIRAILSDGSTLSQSADNFRADTLDELLPQVAGACAEGGVEDASYLCALERLTNEAITKATKKRAVTPEHPFFTLCSTFVSNAQALLLRLTHDFLEYSEVELPRRRAAANVVTFDDLIVRLRKALDGPGSDRLKKAVRARYNAVLVDEFQDTDPAQYEIFQQLFGDSSRHLYYIGDPKQAIYGFRGADIFTYLAAATKVDRTLTLKKNWRSETAFVHALNQLFKQTDHPFVFDRIKYRELTSPENVDVAHLANAPDNWKASLRFVVVECADPASSNKSLCTDAVCEALASDVLSLAESGALLGEQPVGFGDMAVLVRTHKEAEAVRESLRRRGIPSIIHSERSVFQTKVADELRRILNAVLQPRDSAVNAALVTRLLGLNAHDLVRLEENENERQRWLDCFANWRKRWQDECFIAMFRQLVVEQGVQQRLVEQPDGERSLTDLLHIAELLHAAETSGRLSPDGVVAWLKKQSENDRLSQEDYQLRLESDSDAVRISTIHKCKGLEYPIVFCPFLWTSVLPEVKLKQLTFHDRNHGNQLTIDLRGSGSTEPNYKQWHDEENSAESARLLYVAVTRAKNRCTIYVPPYAKLKQSCLALLWDEPARADVTGRIQELAAASEGRIAVVTAKSDDRVARARDTAKHLAPRKFSGRIDTTAMIASFSGLNSGRVELEETAPESADEPVAVTEPGSVAPGSIFDFHRGARAGDFFHAVLEQLDFEHPEFQPLIDDQLKWHGFAESRSREAIVAMFEQLLRTELQPGLRLGELPASQRLVELEFAYRLRRIDPRALRSLFARVDGLPAEFNAHLGRLQFNPVEGYLKGFIDLLFERNGRYYIADWKSNWLGPTTAHYGVRQMEEAMLHRNYHLQAHLYTVAADLYLQQRLKDYDYNRDFGGVFYVFLRGLDPSDPSRGVYFQKPSVNAITTLRKLAE